MLISFGDYTNGEIVIENKIYNAFENPICFNPNQKLYRFAKLNKWKVVVERKDVMYDIAG